MERGEPELYCGLYVDEIWKNEMARNGVNNMEKALHWKQNRELMDRIG